MYVQQLISSIKVPGNVHHDHLWPLTSALSEPKLSTNTIQIDAWTSSETPPHSSVSYPEFDQDCCGDWGFRGAYSEAYALFPVSWVSESRSPGRLHFEQLQFVVRLMNRCFAWNRVASCKIVCVLRLLESGSLEFVASSRKPHDAARTTSTPKLDLLF